MVVDHISATQISMFVRCRAAWMFRYIWGKTVKPKSAMMRGRCVHKAVAVDYTQKVQSKVSLPVADVLDAYSDAYESESGDVAWKDTEDAGKVKDGGVRVLELYHSEVAVKVQPVDVEQSFQMDITWVADDEDKIVKFKGVLDVMDDVGGITDLKTCAQTPKVPGGDATQQVIGYTMGKEAMGDQPTSAHLHYLVALKTPKIVQFDVPVTESRKKFFLTQIPKIVTSMESGNYYAARGNRWCSETACGYHSLCVEEFGG